MALQFDQMPDEIDALTFAAGGMPLRRSDHADRSAFDDDPVAEAVLVANQQPMI
jgi:hypothetical protein